MNAFEYIYRRLNGLPTVESAELIAAKRYSPPTSQFIPNEPTNVDSLSSDELHEAAQRILKSYGIE